jgi:hypothetical protein
MPAKESVGVAPGDGEKVSADRSLANGERDLLEFRSTHSYRSSGWRISSKGCGEEYGPLGAVEKIHHFSRHAQPAPGPWHPTPS